MEAQQQFDKIEAYLVGDLTGSALEAFEQEIKVDAGLAAKVEEHRIAQDTIEFLIESDLRKELNVLRAESETATTTKVVQLPATEMPTTTISGTAKRRSLFPRLAAAASILLVLGFFGAQFFTPSTNVVDQYGEFQMPGINRSGEATDLHPLAEGLELYKEGKYTEAITYYNNIPETDKRYNEAQFYLGHSYSQNKDYSAAIATFKKVAESQDIRFMEKAEWYQLVTLLANNQRDDTFNSLLNKMMNDKGHSYHKKAQELNADF